jgi:hypothetical protein
MTFKRIAMLIESLKQQLDTALEQANPRVRENFLNIASLKNTNFEELKSLIELLNRYRQEYYKSIPSSQESSMSIKDLGYWQWFNFLMSFLESEGKPDLDWAPSKRCWWCGEPVTHSRRNYYDTDECRRQALEWRKWIYKQAKSKTRSEQKQKIYCQAVIKRLKTNNLPVYVALSNVTQPE